MHRRRFIGWVGGGAVAVSDQITHAYRCNYNASRNSHRATAPRRSGLMVRASLHWEAENPHCFCSISICFVMRVAFCA